VIAVGLLPKLAQLEVSAPEAGSEAAQTQLELHAGDGSSVSKIVQKGRGLGPSAERVTTGKTYWVQCGLIH